MRLEEEKVAVYNQLSLIIKRTSKKVFFLIMGDLNARRQEPDNEEEKKYIGHFTFAKITPHPTICQQSEKVEQNRQYLLEHLFELCRTHRFIVNSTIFCRPPEKVDI